MGFCNGSRGVPVRIAVVFLVALAVELPLPAAADEPAPPAEPMASARRWSLGLELGLVDLPRGHIGIPVQGTIDGIHLPAAIVMRWRLDDRMALTAGFGIPHSGLGAAVWVGHEMYWRVATSPREIVALEVYENAGLELGFAGPDWFARHENEFVGFAGYAYVAGGPVAFGLRFPFGLRARWIAGAFDTYLEAAPLVMCTPSPESLFDLSFEIRVRL
jgi:hypothetical protein